MKKLKNFQISLYFKFFFVARYLTLWTGWLQIFRWDVIFRFSLKLQNLKI